MQLNIDNFLGFADWIFFGLAFIFGGAGYWQLRKQVGLPTGQSKAGCLDGSKKIKEIDAKFTCFDRELAKGETKFALLQKDIVYIKESMEKIDKQLVSIADAILHNQKKNGW